MTRKTAPKKDDKIEEQKDKTTNRPIESRNWAFTDFKFMDWSGIYKEYADVIRYVVWGKEICPETGREHFQGWIQLFNKRRMRPLLKMLGSKVLYIRPCYAPEFNNEKYCTKDGKYQQRGKFISQGYRTDLEAIKHRIDNGATMKEIADDNFQIFLQYGRGLSKYKEMVDKEHAKEFRKVQTTVIYGHTDVGKTRSAMEKATYKIEGNALKWWDGYENDKTILIDEFSNNIPITELLNLLDGYQLRLPIKGGHTYARWTKVFITTNVPIDEWYPNARRMHREALLRRIYEYAEVAPQGNIILSGPELLKKYREENLYSV